MPRFQEWSAEDREALMNELYGEPKKISGNEHIRACPYCTKEGNDTKGDNFKFNFKKNVYECFANKSHTNSISKDLKGLWKSNNKKDIPSKPIRKVNPITIPEDRKREWARRKKLSNPDFIINKYHLKWCSVNDCLLIPIGNRYKLKFQTGEDAWDINKKYEEINPKHIEISPNDSQENLVLIEGFSNLFALDTLANDDFRKKYYVISSVHGVTATLGLSKSLDFSKFKRIIVCLDNDTAGQSEAKRIKEQYPKASTISLSTVDLLDYLNSEEEKFKSFCEILDKAISYEEKVEEAALKMLNNKELIQEIKDDVHSLGIVGENKNILRIYLCYITHRFENCLGFIVKGSTSSGKTTLVKTIAKLMPEGIVCLVTTQSENALNYWIDISGKIVLVTESRPPDDKFWEIDSAWRQLIEDNEITRIIVNFKTKDPSKRREEIKVKGPIVYGCTTTLPKLHEENENRLLVFHTDDNPNHVKNIVDNVFIEASSINLDLDEQKKFIVDKHRKVLELLKAFKLSEIEIPYARKLRLKNYGPEASRDAKKLIKIIKTLAFIHQFQREKVRRTFNMKTEQLKSNSDKSLDSSVRRNNEGLIASIKDYEVAYDLFKDYFDSNSSQIPEDLREKYSKIKINLKDRHFSRKQLGELLHLKKTRIHEIIKRMLEEEMIIPCSPYDSDRAEYYKLRRWTDKNSGLVAPKEIFDDSNTVNLTNTKDETVSES